MTVWIAAFISSGEITKQGLVFRISAPLVGSSVTRYTVKMSLFNKGFRYAYPLRIADADQMRTYRVRHVWLLSRSGSV